VEDRIVPSAGGDDAEMRAMAVQKIEYGDKEIYLMIVNK
jgi:hypothetical protein